MSINISSNQTYDRISAVWLNSANIKQSWVCLVSREVRTVHFFRLSDLVEAIGETKITLKDVIANGLQNKNKAGLKDTTLEAIKKEATGLLLGSVLYLCNNDAELKKTI